MKILGMIFCLLFCGTPWLIASQDVASRPSLEYHVNLLDRRDDTFKVRLRVDQLGQENAVFQFAASAPGTYQTMDIGRFVRKFRAFDKAHQPISVKREDVNAWRLSAPERVQTIQYEIAETWDTAVSVNEIYPMAGSSLENDHALINGQAVFGFPRGRQGQSSKVFLSMPPAWIVGTALFQHADGAYLARDFDQLVDSPILAGRLTSASRQVGRCDVRLFVYSKHDKANAAVLLKRLDEVIVATAAFLNEFPVERYTFLYHFEDYTSGAWEHNDSSFYVASEHDLNQVLETFLCRTAAHEIFHMVTPLHIHSERIYPFDFREPKASAHVWFYEGVTEWAAGVMRLRAGQQSVETYLESLSQKLRFADRKDTRFSLEQLSLESYTPKGQAEWENIYNRGAVVAALLDILLLEQSQGERGLREVILELAATYGPRKSFPEAEFFRIFTDLTSPEVGVFIERYIRDTQALPLADYFAHLGINYHQSKVFDKREPEIGFHLRVSSSRKVVLERVSKKLLNAGLREGDEAVSFSGAKITGSSLSKIKDAMAKLAVDSPYTLEVLRQGKRLHAEGKVGQRLVVQHHLFELNPKATEQQIKLREIWQNNRPSTPAGVHSNNPSD